jgi:hypothetical protein
MGLEPGELLGPTEPRMPQGSRPQDLRKVVAHTDRASAPKQVVPMDMTAMVTDEVVPEDGSPAPEVVPEVDSSTTGGAVAATSAGVASAKVPASSSGPAGGGQQQHHRGAHEGA